MSRHQRPTAESPDSPSGPEANQEQISALSAEDLLELVGDEYTREILVSVTGESLTGREIATATDTSRATVYRRLERLEEAGLVVSTQRLDPDGHHCKQFSAPELVIDFEVGADGVDASVQTEQQSTTWGATGFVADD
jgi:DNA-binding transcriptional ArsR family regulator